MEITQEIVKELLDYDENSGVLTWKIRDRKWFPCDRSYKIWNSRDAGKQVKNTDRFHGYIRVGILRKRFKAHRLIWLYAYGSFPKGEIDHINGNRQDNRLVNLRDVDSTENRRNLGVGKQNTSGSIGVYFNKQMQKWQAKIYKGKDFHLGFFDKKEDAIRARVAANIDFGFHQNHGARVSSI